MSYFDTLSANGEDPFDSFGTKHLGQERARTRQSAGPDLLDVGGELQLIRSRFGDEATGSKQMVGRRSGVRPPASERVERHLAALDVSVVDVGDLELAAIGRLQGLDDVEHREVVEI